MPCLIEERVTLFSFVSWEDCVSNTRRCFSEYVDRLLCCCVCVAVSGSHKLHACRLAYRKIPSDSLELITRSWNEKVGLCSLSVHVVPAFAVSRSVAH